MAGVRLGNVMVTAMAAAERPAGCHEWPPGGGEEAAQPWEAICSSSERIESRPKMRMRRAGGQRASSMSGQRRGAVESVRPVDSAAEAATAMD